MLPPSGYFPVFFSSHLAIQLIQMLLVTTTWKPSLVTSALGWLIRWKVWKKDRAVGRKLQASRAILGTVFCSHITDSYTNLVGWTPVEKLNHQDETINGCASHICVCSGMWHNAHNNVDCCRANGTQCVVLENKTHAEEVSHGKHAGKHT